MRLIDADALQKELGKYFVGITVAGVNILIDNQPTMDAVPVAHGLWINENCSICGQYVYQGDVRCYCPNCGAKMDGERREKNDQA